MKTQYLSAVAMIGVIICSITACEAPKSGHYFGGLVHVDLEGDGPSSDIRRTRPGGSSPDVNTRRYQLQSIEWPEFYNQAAKRRRADPNDRSAGTVAVGDCWVDCTSLDPYPMEGFEIALKANVDAAYRRIKHDFGYSTMEEYSGGRVVLEARLQKSLDFRYFAEPGSEYLMRGYIQHDVRDEDNLNTIEVLLRADGRSRTLARVRYYAGNLEHPANYKRSLEQRLMEVVEGF